MSHASCLVPLSHTHTEDPSMTASAQTDGAHVSRCVRYSHGRFPGVSTVRRAATSHSLSLSGVLSQAVHPRRESRSQTRGRYHPRWDQWTGCSLLRPILGYTTIWISPQHRAALPSILRAQEAGRARSSLRPVRLVRSRKRMSSPPSLRSRALRTGGKRTRWRGCSPVLSSQPRISAPFSPP